MSNYTYYWHDCGKREDFCPLRLECTLFQYILESNLTTFAKLKLGIPFDSVLPQKYKHIYGEQYGEKMSITDLFIMTKILKIV